MDGQLWMGRRNPNYCHVFTEHSSGRWVRHVGNAWSSIVYAWIAYELFSTPGLGLRPNLRYVLSHMNIQFACYSFGYHASEGQRAGAFDAIWLQTLCVASTLMLLEATDLMVCMIVFVLLLSCIVNLLSHWNFPQKCVADRYMTHVLPSLILLILLLVLRNGDYGDAALFTLAFVAKSVDMNLARKGVKTWSPLQGTSMLFFPLR